MSVLYNNTQSDSFFLVFFVLPRFHPKTKVLGISRSEFLKELPLSKLVILGWCCIARLQQMVVVTRSRDAIQERLGKLM